MTKFNVNQFVDDMDLYKQQKKSYEKSVTRQIKQLEESAPKLNIDYGMEGVFKIAIEGDRLCFIHGIREVSISVIDVPKLIEFLQSLDFETPAMKRIQHD